MKIVNSWPQFLLFVVFAMDEKICLDRVESVKAAAHSILRFCPTAFVAPKDSRKQVKEGVIIALATDDP